jgi:hypothetical protein
MYVSYLQWVFSSTHPCDVNDGGLISTSNFTSSTQLRHKSQNFTHARTWKHCLAVFQLLCGITMSFSYAADVLECALIGHWPELSWDVLWLGTDSNFSWDMLSLGTDPNFFEPCSHWALTRNFLKKCSHWDDSKKKGVFLTYCPPKIPRAILQKGCHSDEAEYVLIIMKGR